MTLSACVLRCHLGCTSTVAQTRPVFGTHRHQQVRSQACRARASSTTQEAVHAGNLLAAVLALTAPAALALQPAAAYAEDAGLSGNVAAAQPNTGTNLDTVYFGNGCFWGRQKEFVDVEKQALGRTPDRISAVVGYAGGTQAGPGNKVCYYYGDSRTVYERLGHAEVVQINISSSSTDQARQEFRSFADQYFKQFRKTPFGMQRLDPQDSGPGYRNVIGLPGGVTSPLFSVLQEANVNKMELRAGQGNEFQGGKAREGDQLNVVWVVDSNQLPFYRAERYHQFHNGIGKAFPAEYGRDLKNTLAAAGRIDPTGCPELPF